MAVGWESTKHKVDRYNHKVKRILGEYLIGDAPEEIDQHEATDLMVFSVNPLTVACRIRSAERYFWKYYGEFTIRASRPTGTKTELAKIMDGWCDYSFYGYGNESGNIIAYHLYDLNIFRDQYQKHLDREARLTVRVKPNEDGSSEFYIYQFSEFPPGMIIAKGMAPGVAPRNTESPALPFGSSPQK